MSSELKLRRGTAAAHTNFTGAQGEVTIKTDTREIVVHDGVRPGGWTGGGYMPAGTGAVARTVQDKLREFVSVKDFGAVGDGVTDDTAAINAALAAVPVGGVLRFPAGTYRVTSQIVIPPGKRLALIGEGSRQTVFMYAGQDTTVDCFVFGDGSSNCNGYFVQGISFNSSTLMTAGAGVRFRRLNRSRLIDVLFGHQDGNRNFYHGVWFDAIDMVDVTGFQARAQQDAIRVNGGAGCRADLFLSNGKIAGSLVGLHVGGGFGGLYVDSTDIINNATNVLIDRGIVDAANRECFFGPGCYIDTADTTRTATTYNGICVDIQDTSGFVFFNNTWIATCGTAIRTGASFSGTVQIDSGIIFNCFNTFGGNGNGIEIGSTHAKVIVSGTRFVKVDGTAILCTAGTTTGVVLRSPTFDINVNARIDSSIAAKIDTLSSALVSTSQAVMGKTVCGHTTPIASSTDGNPAVTLVTGPAALGGAVHIPYYNNNASGAWLNLSKSRATTVGQHVAVVNNDTLGSVGFGGSDGSVFRSAAAISVAAVDVSGNTIPGEFRIFTRDNNNNFLPSLVVESGHHTRPGADNVYVLGTSPVRWATVFAGTGAINTSDAREKQDIETLTAAELRVATALKGLVKKFRFKDAVQAKGDAARIHVGVITQEVIAAFQAEGLDAMRYGVVCYDEWDEQPAQFDEEGNVVQEYRPAGNRYGIRYEELLAFIIAAL